MILFLGLIRRLYGRFWRFPTVTRRLTARIGELFLLPFKLLRPLPFSCEFPAAASLTGVGTYELKWVSISFRITLLSYDFWATLRGIRMGFKILGLELRECLSFGLWCFDVDEPIKLEFYISYLLKGSGS